MGTDRAPTGQIIVLMVGIPNLAHQPHSNNFRGITMTSQTKRRCLQGY